MKKKNNIYIYDNKFIILYILINLIRIYIYLICNYFVRSFYKLIYIYYIFNMYKF